MREDWDHRYTDAEFRLPDVTVPGSEFEWNYVFRFVVHISTDLRVMLSEQLLIFSTIVTEVEIDFRALLIIIGETIEWLGGLVYGV